MNYIFLVHLLYQPCNISLIFQSSMYLFCPKSHTKIKNKKNKKETNRQRDVLLF